ncbi:transposase [Bradyrhizobium sp. TZ2]
MTRSGGSSPSLQAPRAISSTARRHGISRSLLMTWRRSFGPEPISPQRRAIRLRAGRPCR